MSEAVNATAVSSMGSPTTTTSTTSTTMTTTLECRDEPETPPPPPPLPPPPSNSHRTIKTVRKHRKYVHTSEGTFLWIDGKKIRSALTHRKWPPRRRRVSFPTSDTDLVTGYLEPANPWKHAENVNIEDLISSYKRSCEIHCTEPLKTVIAQLEKLDITEDERCSELNLKNECLWHRACEPLEEILKRVQFEKLDLEATSLDDESAVILFDMLEYYQSAKHLDMSNNRDIGSRGWNACAHMIKKTTCLEILEARDITLTQQHMNILKRSLQLVSHLHVLKLENCGLAGRAFVILVSALKMNTGLKELYLADNGLEQEDAIQLGALLRVNNHLQLLDISNNNIKDEGVRDILDGLITQSSDDRDGKGLSILVLWNNALTKSSSGHFTQAIAQSITLETLNIGKNSVSNELLAMAKDALIKSQTLLQLGMQSTELTCKGAQHLAEIIEKNRSLQRIDLRDNNIQMVGLTALAFAMKRNMSITQLDLDDKPWSKTPATMDEYFDRVSEIRSYCARNEEPTSTDESTEESSSPQHRSRLSSVSSRKISLTCQTLPRSPPSMTPTSNDISTRSMLEPKRTSGGRLRSPAPSPVPSPVASPIPSPSRGRFVVSRVSEASLSSTNSSASSSPVTPPSLASSPTCFFPSSSGGSSSRFRVVTVTEPATKLPPAKSVVTSANTNVTIGFNYTINTPESVDSDDSDSVFRSDLEDDHRIAGNESSASIDIDVSFEEEMKNLSVGKTDNDDNNDNAKDLNDDNIANTIVDTKQTRNIREDIPKVCNVKNNDLDEEGIPPFMDNQAIVESTSIIVDKEISGRTKEPEVIEEEVKQLIDNVDEVIGESNKNLERKTEETTIRDEIIVAFKSEPKKSEPAERQATSLERLLGLFQHPGSLFSGSSFAEKSETKNPIQDGVNSMIALGDKFQQYLREGRGNSGKTSSEDSHSSHAPLQRSVSDASRSTIKIDPVKSLSIPQLSSIQATCTRDLSSKESIKLSDNSTVNVDEKNVKSDITNSTTRKIFLVEEISTDNSIKSENDEEVVPRISDDLPLPEISQSKAKEPLDDSVTSENFEAISMECREKIATEIVNNTSLNNSSDNKTTISAPKLKDIPEYSVLEIRTTNVTIDTSVELTSKNVDYDVDEISERNNVETICDSSTTDSINDPSFKNSSLCNVMCDISGVKNLHYLANKDDVHNNFINKPFDYDGETILDAAEECHVISVSSSSEADDLSTAIAAQPVEEIKNIEKIINVNDENSPEDESIDSNYLTLHSDDKRLENDIKNEVNDESSLNDCSTRHKQTINVNNIDLSLPVFNNSCTNNRNDAECSNAQNNRVTDTNFDKPTINLVNDDFSDTVEEFLPIDATAAAAASIVDSNFHGESNDSVVTNNCININSHTDDLVTVVEGELGVIDNETVEFQNSSRSIDENTVDNSSVNKIPEIDETMLVQEPIIITENIVSLPTAIFSTRISETSTKIEISSIEEDEFVSTTAIEQVSNSLSEDSDYSSKLSVDDVRTSELSFSGSTANSPANETLEQIVAQTSIMNNSLECINIRRDDDASLKPDENRSFVQVAVDTVLTSILNVSTSGTKITNTQVKNSESSEDLMFKITDITNDASFNSSEEVTKGIITTVQQCPESRDINFFQAGQSSRSPTNLYIEKSGNIHRNSQDSGIEETAVSISDDNVIEGNNNNNNQPRESFQESVDSGIDSECSSVCARVDVGADVQKERARDPGKSIVVDSSVVNEIIDLTTNLVAKEEIFVSDNTTKMGNSTYETELKDQSNSANMPEVIGVEGRSNDETTDRSNVSICSTSPE